MSTPANDYGVPPPAPAGDPAAWYAPGVRAQYEVYPGVVVTIRDATEGFAYDARAPSVGPATADELDIVLSYFADADGTRPLTREGAAERMRAGFADKYERAIDRLTDCSPAGRRRLEYHALADVRCFGELTPHALDDRIEVADYSDDELLVHTRDFAPATTTVRGNDHWDRFASERIRRYTVRFLDFDVPVVLYRERVLGADPFTTKYAVREPDLLPGDAAFIAECKDRIWEAGLDSVRLHDRDGAGPGGPLDARAEFVRDRAETLLSRRLTARNTRAWLDTIHHRVRSALAEYDLAVPPASDRFAPDRLDDLVYYVLRDFVGHGKLTIPIRDAYLEDIEANRIGERIKVVPRGVERRVPTNLVFDEEAEFVNVVTQLAAADGVELNASTPSAKVNVDPEETGVDETIRCAVALPIISEDGPHISIRKQSPDPMTPTDLVRSNSLPTELVALFWLLFEHRGVVLFSGATGVGKTTLMNAHLPFIPHDDRPISIDEGSREVRLPHETGVSLKTRTHKDDYKRVTMADLMTQANYLNPDTEVIAEINSPESFATFGEVISTGHGVVGTTHAEDLERLVNRVIEQGLPSYLLSEIDLIVFPRHVDGERYVGSVVELVDDGRHRVEREGTVVEYNTVCEREPDGGFRFWYDHPAIGGEVRDSRISTFELIADRTDRAVEAVERDFHRKHRYVEYIVREGIDDTDELFAFLADLEGEEAATVERERRRTRAARRDGNGRPASESPRTGQSTPGWGREGDGGE